MTDEIDDDEPYGTYAPRRPKRVLHSQVVEFKMSGESVESVAERYDRIRRELREAVERDEAALERRLAARLSAKEAESIARQKNGRFALLELVRMGRVDRTTAMSVLSRCDSWWVRLRDWWRGMR